MDYYKYLLCYMLLVGCMPLGAQEFRYEVVLEDDMAFAAEKNKPQDSTQLITQVQKYLLESWEAGYLLANIDTTFRSGDTLVVHVYRGDKYVFDEVSVDPTDLSIVNAAGLKNVRWASKTIRREMITEYAETLLKYMENNGYPFARVALDSVHISEGILKAKLNLQKNRYVPMDSLHIHGDPKIQKSYLERYLNIYAGDAYNRKRISQIPKRIGDLTFIELDSVPILKFENNTAEVNLYLKAIKASRFDFIIGVQPTNLNGERRFSITGDFTAEMTNRLGRGEYIFANIQSRPETQVLDLRFKYPYIMDFPLGVDAKGSIFFNEIFRETVSDIGLLYQFDGYSALKMSWNNTSSRLIALDTAQILRDAKLPSRLDVSFNGGGLEYSARSLDYLFNPSKGWEISIGGNVGIKKIIRNNRIEALSTEEVDFSMAYDSLELSTLQTELRLQMAYYLPVFRSGSLKMSAIGGMKYNEQQIFENEFYRIGGNKLLRGFDEQSILSDMYLVNTIEFRLLLDRNSYLSFPFVDYGITRIRLDEADVWDAAISFGLGINFATPAGMFNVSFATGRRLDNPLDFGNTKIHFGYVSLF